MSEGPQTTRNVSLLAHPSSLTNAGPPLSLDPLMNAARLGTLRTTASPVHHDRGPSSALTGDGAPTPAWLEEIQRATDAHLLRFFEDRAQLVARLLGPDAEPSELLSSVQALTLRGGKRLRPAMLVASFRAVRPDAIWTIAAPACAALELFQSYLLIHDDWMDGDELRRGGPSVHAQLRDRFGGPMLGDALAILAGDSASAMAWELFVEGALACPGGTQAIATFARIHQEVVLGQEMDLRSARDVGRMQRLKTGSYTVQGPLEIGALLAGAEPALISALHRFGEPLGEAFQVKDDLLGLFGDPKELGKPVGTDLRMGRRNALLRECERLLPAEDRQRLETVMSHAPLSDALVHEIAQQLEHAGIRARVEERLEGLLASALSALELAPFHEPGKSMLRELAERMVRRDR